MSIPCNRILITEQMTTLGLSERTLVSRVQFPLFAFRKARIQGVLDRHITLGQIQKLSTALGVTPADLLTAEPETTSHLEQPQEAANDAAFLIPLLVGLPRRVSVRFLGRTLGWDRSRTTEAVKAIPGALENTGLVLHAAEDNIMILPATRTTQEVRRALASMQTKSQGMNLGHAATLKRIVDGTFTTQRNIGNSGRVVLGALRNMGCIELNEQAAWSVSSDLAAALIDLP